MSDLNNLSPLEKYQQALDHKVILKDPAQYQAVLELNQIYLDLIEPKKFVFFKSKSNHLGIYMFGGVGRGKTYLMDLFFNSLPFKNKLRLHFYRFMAMIHEKLNQLRNNLKHDFKKSKKDPLEIISQDLAQEFKVICLDEFMVEDIADAMILGELLKYIFKNKIVLITTSNTHPDNLYLGGIQRDRFLDSIEILKSNLKIISVDSNKDYRDFINNMSKPDGLSHDLSSRYLSPKSPGYLPQKSYEQSWMQAQFDFLAQGQNQEINNPKIMICDRELSCIAKSEKIIWFEFNILCGEGRGSADYINLANQYSHVLLSHLVQMDDQRDDLARRFVSLIDELYDRKIKLIISASVPIPEIYIGTRLESIFERTKSRLVEMQGVTPCERSSK